MDDETIKDAAEYYVIGHLVDEIFDHSQASVMATISIMISRYIKIYGGLSSADKAIISKYL